MSAASLSRILHVDDEPDIREILRLTLESIGGFTVCSCANGAQAIAAAAVFRPDLILLDVMMPGMDGPRTLAGLRAQPTTARTPVVYMTAARTPASPGNTAAPEGGGPIAVLGKPFDPVELPGRLRRIWDRHGAR